MTHICVTRPQWVNGNIFRVTGPLWFDVFFALRLKKRLSNPSRRRWLNMPLRSLWHPCDHTKNWDLLNVKKNVSLILKSSTDANGCYGPKMTSLSCCVSFINWDVTCHNNLILVMDYPHDPSNPIYIKWILPAIWIYVMLCWRLRIPGISCIEITLQRRQICNIIWSSCHKMCMKLTTPRRYIP